MFRIRGENLRSVFILLFLNVAFFLLEHQDPEKYARLFSFRWDAVRHGEVWRIVTWQFTQAGEGWMEALALFVTLLLLYMMGSAIEEEWGTSHFAALFAVSTLASAGVAAWLGIPLLGTYFVYYTLLFIYAAAFPQQTLYLFGAIPVRFRLIAMISLAALVYGVFVGGMANIAALVGAAVAFLYYLMIRIPVPVAMPQKGAPPPRIDAVAIHNAARSAAIKRALTSGADAEIDRLITQCDRETVQGVNICPPADYKPENVDGYCIRCEGFAECSARHLRLRRPSSLTLGFTAATPAAAPPPPAPEAPPLG